MDDDIGAGSTGLVDWNRVSHAVIGSTHVFLTIFLELVVLSGGRVTGFTTLAPVVLFSRSEGLLPAASFRTASRFSVAKLNGLTTVAFLGRWTIGIPAMHPGARIFRFKGLALNAYFCIFSTT